MQLAEKKAGRQVGRQAGRKASRQVGRQEGKNAGRKEEKAGKIKKFKISVSSISALVHVFIL